jgi:hypothetical protein
MGLPPDILERLPVPDYTLPGRQIEIRNME